MQNRLAETDKPEQGVSLQFDGFHKGLSAAEQLDRMAGRAVLRIRATRAMDELGWVAIEFFLDNGCRIRISANRKEESLAFLFWISAACWWKPWTWSRGYYKGLRVGEGWDP